MKKRIFIIISILILLLVIMGFFLYKNDNFRFKLSYEFINFIEYNNGKKIKIDVPYDNRIKYLNEDDILTYLKNKTGIFYFGYNTCPWCRNIVPVLIDTVKNNNINTIYYIDIHDLNLSDIKEELFSFFGDNLRENENGEKILAVPDVYFIKNGNIIGHHIGTVDSYYNPYKGMSNSEKKELTSIYEGFIKEMK